MAATRSPRAALRRSYSTWSTDDNELCRGSSLRGLSAPVLLDGPMDADAFVAYVEQVLAPDFNPIEMTFSKLKAILRAAAERTLDGLGETVANALNYF